MSSPATAFILATIIALFFLNHTANSSHPSPCDPTNKRDPRTLRHDRITVLINGFSESRIPLLQSLAATYSLSPLVSSVLVLWGNPSTPPRVLHQFALNLTSLSTSSSSAPITLHRNPSASLNSRFLPRHRDISTDAVLICDDDVELDDASFEFAFRVWSNNRNRLIGIFARSHDLDLNRKEWIYTVHHDRYSIVLTKFMIMKSEYLYKYSCEGGARRVGMRGIVDEVRNCEDILMNFVVADESDVGPLMVGVKRVRDYGDARNENENVSGVGLSSRKGEHRKRRGWCIREFHRVLGRMPLRYSYGKVVDSVGEQGLCKKGGKLVFCDQ
ncbi:hypothetical protein RIF29_27042 [Crotalaria pallida]|uniref:Glycosyl transferase 64 domain-containing protein n=1 Tax=Crotalaria pallida TaxID=3830 RepID=A0AAN9EQP9_CROPI